MLAEKGKPDFSMFNTKEVIDMRLCLNKLIGCYSFDKEKKELLEKMWIDLSQASADKISEVEEKDLDSKEKIGITKRKIIRRKI